jgi:hypothetical protein
VIGAGTLAVILLVFFVAGIGAGVVVVIALPARRTRKPPRPDWPVNEDEPGWPVSGGSDWPRGGE